MCLVETGGRAPAAACVMPVEALPRNRATGEINVKTNTPLLRSIRKTNLELLLSNHDKKCLSCPRNTNCELQQLCREYGVEDVCLSLPVLLGNGKVQGRILPKLTDEELQKLHTSANALKNVISQLTI